MKLKINQIRLFLNILFKSLILPGLCTILISTAYGDSNTARDILTPNERQWLMENQSRIVLAVETNYQPYVFMGSDGEITGLANDYMRLLESKLGIRFNQRRFSSLDDIFAKIRSGEVQITNAVTQTPWRSTFLVFTEPYITVPNVIIVRKDRSGSMNERDLAGLRVSLVESYAVTEYITGKKIDIKPDTVKDDLSALLNVAFDRSDAAVIDLASASFLISQKNIANLRVAGEVNYDIRLAVGTPKTEPVLHNIIKKGLSVITDEEKADIRKRWINYGSNHSVFDDWRFWAISGSVFFLVFTVIAVIVGWNRTLRQQISFHTAALKKEKEALRKSEDSLKRAANAGNVGLWDWDLRTGQVFYSTEWKKQLGYEDHEIEGRYDEWEKRLHPDDIDATISLLKNSQTPPWPPYKVEFRLRHRDGSYRWISATGAIDFDENRNPIRMMGSHVDITVSKTLEEEREILERQLNQAQKIETVGRLAGGIAHDFNNMLGIILGYTEVVLEDDSLESETRDSLFEIQKAALRSSDLTRQLLAFARKQTVSPKVIEPNESVNAMMNMIQRLIGEDIQLMWNPGKDLWPVKIDPSQMDQILINLCVNSRDSIAGVGNIVIETANRIFDPEFCAHHPDFKDGEYVEILIGDSGTGMDEDTLSHIFEPFFTTKKSGLGTGLGLSMVYGIIKQNNGFINVSSEPDHGTTFKIYLPRFTGEITPIAEKEDSKPVPDGHETILLVEDQPEILNMTTKLLNRQGYTVLPATNATEAIRLANIYEKEIHLLMTDVIMPEMNGRDLAKEITTKHPGFKCLFMSGYTADIISHHGILDEGIYFIQKPFSSKDLSFKVREALNGN